MWQLLKMHSMSLNKNHFCLASVYHHLLSGEDVEKELVQEVTCTYFLFQINWVNVITPKPSQRQKAAILVTFESLGLFGDSRKEKHEHSCWIIDLCHVVRPISLKRKINYRNSSSFHKPLLSPIMCYALS